MSDATAAIGKRCAPGGASDVALPLASAAGPIRRSRMGRIRAVVLLGVHALIAVHIAHWLSAGRTLTPLEPSEAMEFSKHGLVNAGLIFFLLAIASTLVFGRFFCGWGCHVIALQDLCRWLLGRIGLRPRAMRSRLLVWAPLIAFVYMFILPLLARGLLGRPLGVSGMHLTTDALWATFPGWAIGGATFLVCGFLIVYALGSKGFCTYGCPYGGIFGLTDKLAIGRIRVTDACQHCGHCTAVCSSNVRVGDEVARYGMVVDPGCMKCMDCVSVCPNGALYFGWGRPAVLPLERSAAPAHRRRRPAGGTGGAAVLSLCFAAALFVLFHELYDVLSNAGAKVVVIVLWVGASIVCGRLAVRGQSDYSLGEEVALATAFLAVFGVVRGLYGAVPFLLSLGVAAIASYLVVQTLRLARAPHVKVQRWTLRKGGTLTRAGAVYLAVMAVLSAAWLHSAVVRIAAWQVDRAHSAALHEAPDLFQWVRFGSAALATDRPDLRRALAAGVWLSRWALADHGGSALKLARLHALAGRTNESIRALRDGLNAPGATPQTRRDLAFLLAAAGRPSEAVDVLTAGLAPGDTRMLDATLQLGLHLAGDRRFDDAARLFDAALAAWPEAPSILHNYAILETTRSRPDAAVALLERALAMDPEQAASHHLLGEILLAMERPSDALPHLEAAARLAPDTADVARLLGLALIGVGRIGEAEASLKRAVDLAPDRADLHLTLARFYSMTSRPELAQQHAERARTIGR